MPSSIRITAAYAFAAAIVFAACTVKNRSVAEKDAPPPPARLEEPKSEELSVNVPVSQLTPPTAQPTTPPPQKTYHMAMKKSESSSVIMRLNDAEKMAYEYAPSPASAQGIVAGQGGAMAKRKAGGLGRRDQMMLADEGYSMPADREFNTEEYSRIYENPFLEAKNNPLSTFSIDVDAASYANARRFIQQNQLPPADAVRIEEFINYFDYDYPQPEDETPFSITTEMASCPWNAKTRLVHIGLQGLKVETSKMPPANITFLIDVSGSMDEPNKLPLVKRAMRLLIDQLRPQDRISMVVYAGAAGTVLPPTSGSEKATIIEALERLQAGGSTAGGQGLMLAYKVAQQGFLKHGNNRIILATDGDFNVGVSSDAEMVRLIEEKRKSGVFISVLGFGMGNYKDSKMEQIADKGNGNYAYIDNIMEARKVFVEEIGGTLLTIAKDVKLQIEFNPAKVGSYRLVGYENRMLRAEDFNDDTKDAGELGAGHSVTALYEIAPPGVEMGVPKVDPLKYQKQAKSVIKKESWSNRGERGEGAGDEVLTVKFRYKEPNGTTSKLLSRVLKDGDRSWEKSSENFRFSAAAAGLGLLLRDSQYKGSLDYSQVVAMAKGAKGKDNEGHRAEFIRLAETASLLATNQVGQREPEVQEDE